MRKELYLATLTSPKGEVVSEYIAVDDETLFDVFSGALAAFPDYAPAPRSITINYEGAVTLA